MAINEGWASAIAPVVERMRTDVVAVCSKGRMRWVEEALHAGMLAHHCNGGPQVGLGFILPGTSTCRAAVLDLDAHKGETPFHEVVAVADKLLPLLESRGLAPVPWSSRSGTGINVWMLWDAHQDAHSVRALLRDVLAEAGFRDGTGGVARGQIEIFPKQDAVALGDFGNQVILPGAGLGEPLEPIAGWAPMGKDYAEIMEWPASAPVPVRARPERTAVAVPPSGDLMKIKSALAAIPNTGEGLSYEDWRNVVFAVHHACGGADEGLELVCEWSAQSDKHDEQFLRGRVWPYIRSGDDRETVITEASLWARARDAGWVEDVSDEFDVVVAQGGGEGSAGLGDMPRLTRDKHGRIEATAENILALVSRPDLMGIEMVFDVFRDEPVWRGWRPDRAADDAGWRPWDEDYIPVALRARMERLGVKPMARALIHDCIAFHLTARRIDTALIWADTLKWDGVPRIETFVPRYLGTEDTAYTRSVGLYLWTALAGRCLASQKPSQADMVPVLIGGQGVGKTRAVQALAPSLETFVELSPSKRDADAAREMRGKLVGELGEMRGMRAKELEDVRAWISRAVEEWVPKYREKSRKMNRRLVMIGTSNEEQILFDHAGNRRWLPVTVGAVDVAGIVADREQLWAEGIARYKMDGVVWHEAETLARDVHEAHLQVDAWQEIAEEWLRTPVGSEACGIGGDEDEWGNAKGDTPMAKGFVTGWEIATGALDMDAARFSKADQMRLAAAMKLIGLVRVKRRIGGRPSWVWEEKK